MKTPNTFSELIGLWGIAQFAGDIGVTYSTANAMKQRNSIPAKYWARVVEKAAKRDISCTADRLMQMERGIAA